MKKIILHLTALLLFSFTGFSQADEYNLKTENLHKKVKKTRTHYYMYHGKSKGFVKLSVTENTYNDDGNLIERFYDYTSSYDGTKSTSSTLYNYNSKGQLISTQDVSAKKSKYSSYYRFFYDGNGNPTKKEVHYTDGSIATVVYTYDSKNRRISMENNSSSGVMTSRTRYEYNGDKKTEIRQSFNIKDGSISGTYTTVYKDDLRISYKSDTTYGKSGFTYKYDKNDNIIATTYEEDPNSGTSYNYAYDSKGNWTKKHYKSGNNHYFYFREVQFKNGDKSGSSNFDANFVNQHQGINNSAVVPLTPTKVTNTTADVMPVFTSKNWAFNYVNLDNTVSALKGDVKLQVLDNSKMAIGTTVKITYSFGGKDYMDRYNVTSFDDTSEYSFWTLKSLVKETTLSITLYKQKQYVETRDLYLAGVVMFSFNNKKTSFYLE
ncbi:hypothetical protein GCM10011416_04610 [Polaribacter pacificus]|uniref:YD repeat-containing protein n=1 Tax=Polaribacter pacificus TaxID=1775173 RepID=A0A917MC05_9FLAO|nr:hypothetical protein [Polaribacter pacificus]GGG91130.1 hypothetical protein GCM10011416_04610 [Polaribacter pacificus]